MSKLSDVSLDLNSVENVQLEIREDGRVIWVNVDGVNRLRCNALRPVQDGFEPGDSINLTVNDNRPGLASRLQAALLLLKKE